MSPSPLVWSPSNYWDGNDGAWSTFWLQIGNPSQMVRVLPSTNWGTVWAVAPEGCPKGTTGLRSNFSKPCEQSRGLLFNSSMSNSWRGLGNYTLGVEKNFGFQDSAVYGLDTIASGLGRSSGTLNLTSQVIATIETSNLYLGMLGLGHRGINLTNFNNPLPSPLSSLKSRNLIPSLSWGYTAGAPYRLKGIFGSLTFGGFDASRFNPNNVSFTIAEDPGRDLVVGLQSINSSSRLNTGKWDPLLPSPILTFIDSTLPYIYLPEDACRSFENAFDLVYNEREKAYLVDSDLHRRLVAADPKFTFTIGNSKTGGATVDIVLPYASFDLTATAANNSRYFPLAKAANESQYILGRTFLQEAYLFTDYERSNFSVSQARFEDNSRKNIIAVTSPTEHRKRSNIPQMAGVAAGTAAILLILAFMIWMFRHRRGKAKLKKQAASPTPSQPEPNHAASEIPTLLEIDQNSMVGPIREIEGRGRVELQDELSPTGSGIKFLELAQALPPELCASGHSLEKLPVRTEPRDAISAPSVVSKTDHSSCTSSEVPTVEKHSSSRAKRELSATNEPGTPILSRHSSSALWEIYALYQDSV